MGSVWHQRRQDLLQPPLLVLRDDRVACITAHQLVIHQVVVAEEQLPNRSAMMRVIARSMSAGVVVKDMVSSSSRWSLIPSIFGKKDRGLLWLQVRKES